VSQATRMRIPARCMDTKPHSYRGWTIRYHGRYWRATYRDQHFRVRLLPQAVKYIDIQVAKGHAPWWERLEHAIRQWAEA
jgi:hypothetical protein